MYIFQSLISDTSFSPEMSPKDRRASTFPYSHTPYLLVHSSLLAPLSCMAVVQWSRVGWASLGSRIWIPDIRWPLFIPWYHCQVAKDYPNCCHTVLRRDLQCYMHLKLEERLASHVLNIFKRERKHLRHHYKKSDNLRQITGEGSPSVPP